MNIKEYLNEGVWFSLGKEVNFAYDDKRGNSSILRPNKKILKIAAQKLNISLSDAEIALGIYNSSDPVEDEKIITKKPKTKG